MSAPTRTRHVALRAADVVAVLALVAALGVIGARVAGSEGAARDVRAQQPPSAPAEEGDRDGDGVPDEKDLAPDTAGPRPTPRPKRTPAARPPASDCESRGISLRSGAGSCVLAGGTRIKVADRGSVLSLEELELRGGEVEQLSRIGSGRRTIRATGRFLAVTVTLTNKLDGIVYFQPDHMRLTLGQRVYSSNPATAFEDPLSLARRADPLRPGRSVTGRVLFDLEPRDARSLGRRVATLRISQFSDIPAQQATMTVGFLRLSP